ncbi:Asp23/Gls24 family envelope stress response protein [Rhodococcus sp. BP-349]|uniref:Asp23/Gls24 family envelope stress response protein n=1 Tax=unclassified Rhodococcus (in: high G+C Gram-positive bacteria) TaxID=192944 RepID=UPI001C9B7FDD|nr:MULTISPECIES: Asp23/Gls24 family envelope stress response protein [unclassified Rhodococcus (in: high G+C Gram-positive bacteria)]MBY6539555.1 Asp23/Gls24 family envelope stress response protein [Rhodococcus sp. BP-363]MBY6544117.1 Asp23/Gls24 family envelope stress response protein [Rhodococcus sp. BP-369]MBY6563347.1 Asp23/Gls24 family envelope stress response protein [Rhodococcus sp. BP-370]MBY6577639.1 Asp23/Gls24 family envelope stress response protein [Rhodococcus sp. BP-364]MBY658694
MADTAPSDTADAAGTVPKDPSVRPDPGTVDPAQRGSLTVLDRAVESIADASLGRTDGVVTSGGSFGRRPSRVKVTKQDDRVRAAVDVTVAWPRSAASVADDLRRDIARGMTDSGLRTDSVDVHVGDFGSVSSSAAPASGATPAPTTRPLAAPAATPIAIVVSLLLLAGAGVLIRDALVGFSVISGREWTASALDWIDGLTPLSWMFPAGIAIAVVGALLVLASLKWRARRYRSSGIAEDVWVHKADLAKVTEPEPAVAAAPETTATPTVAGGEK